MIKNYEALKSAKIILLSIRIDGRKYCRKNSKEGVSTTQEDKYFMKYLCKN